DARQNVGELLPHAARIAQVDAVRGQLIGITGAAESDIDPPAAQNVERRHALRDVQRMVDRREHDADAEADARGALSERRRWQRRSQSVGLPTQRTTFLSEGVMEFWTEPQMASIHKMLNPRSIAIVGATPRMQYGGRFLAAALKAKDRVRVYAVNPRYDEIMGEKSYRSVTDLPEAPDLVGIVVPYDQVLDVLQESRRKGAGSAIVISAGFAERGVDDRRDLQ